MNLRDNRFDNLKGFLIIIVVIGHFLGQKMFFPAGKMPLIQAIYACIYSFHMPAMVMISGYFSKKSTDAPGYIQKQIRSILIPFVVFDLLQWLVISRKPAALLFPRFTMWYLLSLFFWKLLLPVIKSFRFPLTLSVVLALLVGLTKASVFLSVSRTIVFFPIFLAGYYLRAEQLEKLRRLPKIVPILSLALCLGLAVLLISSGIRVKLFHMKGSYKTLSLQPLQGMLLRALALAMGFTASLSLFALSPARKTLLTGLGTRTISVYLTHGLIIKLIRMLKLPYAIENQALLLLSALAFSAVICLLFGNRFVAKRLHAFFDWIGGLLLKREA